MYFSIIFTVSLNKDIMWGFCFEQVNDCKVLSETSYINTTARILHKILELFTTFWKVTSFSDLQEVVNHYIFEQKQPP